jgi:hypothetical protein
MTSTSRPSTALVEHQGLAAGRKAGQRNAGRIGNAVCWEGRPAGWRHAGGAITLFTSKYCSALVMA